MPDFDYFKPFQTRDGQKATLMADDIVVGIDSTCLAVRIKHNEQLEDVRVYDKSGQFFPTSGDHPMDLINIPETKELWVVIFIDGLSCTHTSLMGARECLRGAIWGIKHISVKKGENL